VQTLKTAAIVILLMTVMYGAYVSLTTPPEPLPEDVQDILEFNEEGTLAIDAGLPDSLGELDINTGMSTIGEPATPSPAGTGSLGVAALDPSAANPTAVEAIAAAISDSRESGVMTTLTDVQSGPPSMPIDAALGAAAGVAANRSYPSTNDTFELPDPNDIESSFDASGHSKPDLPQPDLALTSGTSDTRSASVPPAESGVSRISAADVAPSTKNIGLVNAIRTADKQFAADKRKDALATLSIFYNTPNLSGEQRSELLSRLDPLAREVIYSKRHLLEQPHRVGQNETLMEVATRYEVPWQLLANINQIDDPVTVLPGTELKVVRGPFRAEVNLSLKELTLFLGDLYAGRFPIAIGRDPAPKPGTFTVQDKQTARTFYDAAGSPVPAGSPDNPYGDVWLDLGGQLCIHGSPSTTSPTEKGCISLAADYADDLYGILSQGSSVTIRR
jgi:lipoprotein-anchoring transpeptidase ErfK/SrfK